MSNLQHRQTKIQEKRKQTPWRQFLMEIASWMPMSLYKNDGLISPYSQDIKRIGGIIKAELFDQYRERMPEIMDSGSFFVSMMEGFKNSTLSGTKVLGNNENAEFSYITLGAKNAYLSIVVVDSQNICYSYSSFRSADIMNSILVENASVVYSSRAVSRSSWVFYSSNIQDCNNIRCSSNLIGCTFCFGCNNLTNQSYCINNVLVGKENYQREIAKLIKDKKAYADMYKNICGQPGYNVGENISGSFNRMCANIQNGIMNYQIKNGRNVVLGNASELLEDVADCVSIGGLKSSHLYGCMGVGYGCEHVYCSVECSPSCNNIYYSYLMDSCSFCIGCIGLKNKQFCIFNKQYTKEEWYEKADEIFAQMDATPSNSPLSRGGSQLGEFFPGSMNPFYFNDTAAYLIDPTFTKEEVTAAGYLRRDEPIKVDIPTDMSVIQWSDLDKYEGRMTDGKFVPLSDLRPAGSVLGDRTINADILKVVIQDEQGNYYRIIPMEYKFLVKHGLPLPRKHRLERMKENFRIHENIEK